MSIFAIKTPVMVRSVALRKNFDLDWFFMVLALSHAKKYWK